MNLPKAICGLDPPIEELAKRLFPGKRIRDFSLHFPLDGAATLKAEILMTEDDVGSIMAVATEYDLQAIEQGEVVDAQQDKGQ